MPNPTIITLEPILPVQIVAKAFPEVLAGDVDVIVNSTLYDTETPPGSVNVPVTNLNNAPVGVVTPGVGVKVGNSLVLIKKTGGALIEAKAVVAEGENETTVDDSVVLIKDSGGVVLHSKTVKADDIAEQVVSDSTVNVRKSDGVLIAAVPVKAQATVPYDVANSTVTMKDSAGATLDSKSVKATESAEFTAPNATAPIKDSAGVLLKTEVFKSGETRDVGIGDSSVAVKDSAGATLHTKTVKAQGTAEQVVSDSVLTLNGGAFLNVKSQASQNIQLLSSVDDSPIMPVSVVGEVIKVAPGGGASPIGVLFKETGLTGQWTIYGTNNGDDGWLVQNLFYNIPVPSNPKVKALLDTSLSNYFYRLVAPLIVDGVSSTTRFVDCDGVQTFPATGNKNLVFIDKLTGYMWYRDRARPTSGPWETNLGDALTHSVVIDGVTYDDWILPTRKHLEDLFPYAIGANIVDGSITILTFNNGIGTGTTDPASTISNFRLLTTGIGSVGKGSNQWMYLCRKCDNLITAP